MGVKYHLDVIVNKCDEIFYYYFSMHIPYKRNTSIVTVLTYYLNFNFSILTIN